MEPLQVNAQVVHLPKPYPLGIIVAAAAIEVLAGSGQ